MESFCGLEWGFFIFLSSERLTLPPPRADVHEYA